MTNVAIAAVPRDDFGKGVARKLRAAGLVPAVIYGHESEVRHVSLPAHELNMALTKTKVVLEVVVDGATLVVAPRQIQRDPVRRIIEHVDLVLLSDKEQREREHRGLPQRPGYRRAEPLSPPGGRSPGSREEEREQEQEREQEGRRPLEEQQR